MSPRHYRAIVPMLVVGAGVLLSLTGASRAFGAPQRLANPPSTSSLVVDHYRVDGSEGDVQPWVPRVVIASTDGLPATLVAGTTYVLEVHVWVAGGEAPMAASVDVFPSATTECAPSTVPAATISTIRCHVLPLGSGAGTIVVRARVGPLTAPVATANFTHAVNRPTAAA